MISLLCKRAQSLLARVLREESGSAAVNVVFFLIGGIALTAFVAVSYTHLTLPTT